MDEAWRRMIVECVRFAVWAAGEGLTPAASEPAEGPEDFLFEFSKQTGFEDWDDLAELVQAKLAQRTG